MITPKIIPQDHNVETHSDFGATEYFFMIARASWFSGRSLEPAV